MLEPSQMLELTLASASGGYLPSSSHCEECSSLFAKQFNRVKSLIHNTQQ